MNPDTIFGANDDKINGDILGYSQNGEIYDATASQIVHILHAQAGRDTNDNFAAIAMTRSNAYAMLLRNYDAIIQSNPAIDPNLACDLAYFRILAIKYNLISLAFTAPTIHNCYNQVARITNAGGNLTAAAFLANDNEGITAVRKAAARDAIDARLVDDVRTSLNKVFVNLVCLMAFMFRTRGHHYLASYGQKYQQLWSKVKESHLYPNPNFMAITTTGLHAIPPICLDNFWGAMANAGRCDETLILRYDSLAAGTAIFGILDQGAKDLKVTFPQLALRLQPELEFVERSIEEIRDERWAHSINARFYGADANRLSETRVASLGAIIRACIIGLQEEHPLGAAPSLQRIASSAPITGVVYQRAIRSYVASDEFARRLALT